MIFEIEHKDIKMLRQLPFMLGRVLSRIWEFETITAITASSVITAITESSAITTFLAALGITEKPELPETS